MANLFYLLLAPLLVVPLATITVYICYRNLDLTLFFLCFPLLITYIITFQHQNYSIKKILSSLNNSKNEKLSGVYWTLYSRIIFLISFIELGYFGLPLMGGTVYASFGFPFLHHITVSSWLLLFINYKSKKEKIFFYSFSILNPLIIVNRDLLLLTLFCILVKLILNRRIKPIPFALCTIFIIIVFGYIGQLRSSHAMKIVELPTKFILGELNPIIFWFFIYFSSSTFNVAYNIGYFTNTLYCSQINVFPEYYAWIMHFGIIGYYCFFISGYLLLFLILKIRLKSKLYLLIFLYYQFVMGSVFANKLFISHTLFTIILFILASIFNIKTTLVKNAFDISKNYR